MLSPMQGSPILSNQNSINSWANQKLAAHPVQPINQFIIHKEESRHSLTEIANENSFDQPRYDCSANLI
jgi:hypothetical protein